MEALSIVRGKLPPVIFRVLGGGDQAPWIAEAKRYGVDDITIFQGTLTAGEAVLKWLDDVDLYLQPSFQEGLPRALIEAMSRGCPALASKCAGIPELLDASCLIRPGDSIALGRLLLKVLHDKDWQRMQGKRNWEGAGKYAREVLDARRYAFWENFASNVSTKDRK
jgi:glycosyltransferase involved in cell wall biosynthesis